MSEPAEPYVPSTPSASAAWRLLPSGASPWGVIAALAIAAFASYGARRAMDALLTLSLPHGQVWGATGLLLVWGTELAVIVLAVRVTQIPVRDYLGWTRPRAGDVALGLVVAVALGLLPNLLTLLFIGKPLNPSQIADYREQIAAGWSNLRIVLNWWPAILLAPLVEETVFRGFLWRSIAASRLGNIGALLLTAVLFSAIHYNQTIMSDGSFNAWPLIEHFIDGLALGALRWRSGTTTITIVMHVWMNLWTSVAVIVLLPLT
jgi:membrane protease YdiL (CAAX protease family)